MRDEENEKTRIININSASFRQIYEMSRLLHGWSNDDGFSDKTKYFSTPVRIILNKDGKDCMLQDREGNYACQYDGVLFDALTCKACGELVVAYYDDEMPCELEKACCFNMIKQWEKLEYQNHAMQLSDIV